jgi:hypothetical protein
MSIKNVIKILVLIAGLMVILLLTSCFSNNTNKIKIKGR